jgi:GDP-4-dehydro-6-deoxy-D-mannose reductase
MRVLVTGAGGFVGRHLLPALAAAFPAAKIIGTGQNGGTDISLDITDITAVKAAFESFQPDICVHLAAIAAISAAKGDPDLTWRVNFFGALNVGQAIMAAAPACKMLFISSSETYGASFRPGTPLDETAPLAPMNIYAASKAAAEMGLSALSAEGLRLIRLRPFNHTGAGQSEAFVIPSFAGQIARIEAGLAPPEMVVGTLETERDFLDVRDVCRAYIACIEHFDRLPNNQVVNIASGQPLKVQNILDLLLAQSNTAIAVRQDSARLRKAEIMRAAGIANIARDTLHWQPRIPLGETLAWILQESHRQARLPINGLPSRQSGS